MVAKKKDDAHDAPGSAGWPFGKKNYILFGAALAIIILGYIFLGSGDDPNNTLSLTIAPIVLVIGYGLIPFAIMAREKTDDTEPASDEEPEA